MLLGNNDYSALWSSDYNMILQSQTYSLIYGTEGLYPSSLLEAFKLKSAFELISTIYFL